MKFKTQIVIKLKNSNGDRTKKTQNVAKVKFKSQLQMATKLNLNRITLRKKIEQYFGNNND